MIIYFHLLETHRYIVKYMHNASPFHLADATVAPAQAHPRPGGAVKRCAGPVSLSPTTKAEIQAVFPNQGRKAELDAVVDSFWFAELGFLCSPFPSNYLSCTPI
jgi:hypothetical protein